MKASLRGLAGERGVLRPFGVSAWIASLILLTLVVATNQVLARESFFFVAHGTSPRVLILLWILLIGSVLLVLTGVFLAVQRYGSQQAFDAIASVVTLVFAVFLLGNAFGWPFGVVGGVGFTAIARRIDFGRVMLVIAGVAAMLPLVGIDSGSTNHFAARVVDHRESERPSVLWILPDRAQYQVFFNTEGVVRSEYPHLRDLQKTSTTFSRAYSTANGTELSVPSMLNGVAKIPTDPKEREILQRSPGIASWLSPVYDVSVASVIFPDLCTALECSQSKVEGSSFFNDFRVLALDVVAVAGNTLAPHLASKFPDLDGRWRDFWATSNEADGGEEPLDWESTIGSGAKPDFVLWHSLGTHDPYNRDFEGKPIFGFQLPEDVGTWSNLNGSSPSDRAEQLSRRLYLAAAADFDRQLGALVERLKASGVFDEMMVILNSDHGRAFTRSGDGRIGDDQDMVWNEVAHVPLMVKLPGQKASEIVSEPRTTAQIAATILEVADVVVRGGPTLAPTLQTPPAEGPYFMVDLGLDEPQLMELPASLPAEDNWQQSDSGCSCIRVPVCRHRRGTIAGKAHRRPVATLSAGDCGCRERGVLGASSLRSGHPFKLSRT